jgi:hypothetical protein
MNTHKRHKKFTIIIIQDERLVCSFKFPLYSLKICAAVIMGLVILSVTAVLFYNTMRESNKEELITRIETQNNPAEAKENGKEVSSLAANPYNLSIEDFRSRFDETKKLFRYSFLLKNKDSKNTTVSGYIFVILKSEGLAPEQWLSYPHTILVNGVPQNFRDGDPFSITKHKTIAKDISIQYVYDYLSIIVCSHDGKIILENKFSMQN